MRFDTEEAYFRAMRTEAKTDPQGIVREFRHREMSLSWDERFRQHVPGKGKSAADTFLAGAVVSLIRAAYSVHQKALDRRSAGDELLGFRIDRASQELPEGWQLAVHVERGTVAVLLVNPDGQQVPLDESIESVSERVFRAVSKADSGTKGAARTEDAAPGAGERDND